MYIQIDVGSSSDFIKGEDILDIWFDSGVSWASVLPGIYNDLSVKRIVLLETNKVRHVLCDLPREHLNRVT